MKYFLKIMIVFFGLFSATAQNLKPAYYNQEADFYNVGEERLAVQGYDLVAYRTENKALKGSVEYQYTHDGVVYHFTDEAHKSLFIAEPVRYLPAYGGYCAFSLGMPNGFGGGVPGKYPVNPESFKISNGRLYLFYEKDGFEALRLWNKAEERIKKMADLRWQQMEGK